MEIGEQGEQRDPLRARLLAGLEEAAQFRDPVAVAVANVVKAADAPGERLCRGVVIDPGGAPADVVELELHFDDPGVAGRANRPDALQQQGGEPARRLGEIGGVGALPEHGRGPMRAAGSAWSPPSRRVGRARRRADPRSVRRRLPRRPLRRPRRPPPGRDRMSQTRSGGRARFERRAAADRGSSRRGARGSVGERAGSGRGSARRWANAAPGGGSLPSARQSFGRPRARLQAEGHRARRRARRPCPDPPSRRRDPQTGQRRLRWRAGRAGRPPRREVRVARGWWRGSRPAGRPQSAPLPLGRLASVRCSQLSRTSNVLRSSRWERTSAQTSAPGAAGAPTAAPIASGDQSRVVERGEVDEPGPVLPCACDLERDLDREARLADAPRADERRRSCPARSARQARRDRRRGRRSTSVGRVRLWPSAGGTRGGASTAGEPGPVAAKSVDRRSKSRTRKRPSGSRRADSSTSAAVSCGEQDLTAAGGTGNPRRLVDDERRVVALGRARVSGVHADPNPAGPPVRRAGARCAAIAAATRAGAVAEDDEEPVADRLHLVTAVLVPRCSQQLVVSSEYAFESGPSSRSICVDASISENRQVMTPEGRSVLDRILAPRISQCCRPPKPLRMSNPSARLQGDRKRR